MSSTTCVSNVSSEGADDQPREETWTCVFVSKVEEANCSPESRFEILDVIGEGAFGTVRKVFPRPGNQQVCEDAAKQRCFALKSIPIKTSGTQVDWMREVEMVKKFDHPGVVRCYDTFFSKNTEQEVETIHLQMEFCARGSLEDLLELHSKSNTPIPEEVIIRHFVSVVEALVYIHKEGCLHRDIKPANILVTEDGTTKVGDFGLAKNVTVSPGETCCGSFDYMAPEFFNGHGNQTEKVDIYSLACVVYRLCTLEKRPPPRTDTTNPHIPLHYSGWLKQLIILMLHHDVAARPTACELLKTIQYQLGQYSFNADPAAAAVDGSPEQLATKAEAQVNPISPPPQLTGAAQASEASGLGAATTAEDSAAAGPATAPHTSSAYGGANPAHQGSLAMPGVPEALVCVPAAPLDERSQPPVGDVAEGESWVNISTTMAKGEGARRTSMYDESDEDEDEGFSVVSLGCARMDLARVGELIASSQETLTHIAGRDVVILLGKTGTGKSTLIHALAGCSLQRRQHRSAEDGICKDVYEPSEALPGFAIGHDMKSETKTLRHFERPTAAPAAGDAVVYLDSAGYEDTAGVEVDIATSVSFRKVADVCRRLRFVVLINCASFFEDRGGALRGLVKLVSAMVGRWDREDFKPHRFAFTFLFTHTDMLYRMSRTPTTAGGVPAGDDLDEVERGYVRGLLEDTLKGTPRKDAAARSILKWMIRCLKHCHPFVDVFHPERTDAGRLAQLVERFAPEDDGLVHPAIGLDPAAPPCDVVRCGLSPQNASAIALELKALLQELRVALEHELLHELGEVTRALALLHQHVPIEAVADAYRSAADAVDARARKVLEEVYDTVQLGTSVTGDFNGMLAARTLKNITLLGNLARLGVGDALRASEEPEVLDYLRTRVVALQQLLRDALEECEGKTVTSLEEAERCLSKLCAWGDARSELVATAAAGVDLLEAFVQRAVASAAETEPVSAAAAVARLGLVRASLPNLRGLRVAAAGVEEAYAAVVVRVQEAILTWTKEATEALADSGLFPGGASEKPEGSSAQSEDMGALRTQLGVFTERARQLEELGTALDAVEASPQLAECARQARREMQTQARAMVSRRGDAVRSAIAQGVAAPALQPAMQALALSHGALTETQRREGGGTEYDDARSTLAALLKQRHTQLCALCDRQGDGSVASVPERSLAELAACAWLDDLLEPRDRFVRESVGDAKGQYAARLESVGSALSCTLARYLGAPREHRGELDALHAQLAHIEHLAATLSRFPGQEGLPAGGADVERATQSLVDEWCSEQLALVRFPEDVGELGDLDAAALEAALEGCEGLKRFFARVTKLLADKVGKQLQRYHELIQALMQAEGRYETKKAVLDAMDAWRARGLNQLMARLPELHGLQRAVREDVAALARRIRTEIEESPDIESAASGLEALASARAVDEHVGEAASASLASLSHLADVKRAGLDKEVQRCIAEFKFEAIGGHLGQLAGGKGPAKQLRFQSMIDAVHKAVLCQIDGAKAAVVRGREAAEAVRSLEKAGDSIGKLMKQHKAVDLFEEARMIKQRSQEHFQQLLTRLQSALEASDFLAIDVERCAVEEYREGAKQLISRRAAKRAREQVALAQQSLVDVNMLLDAFVQNVSSRNPRSDTSKLLPALNQLKAAASSSAHLAQFYGTAVGKLRKALHDAHLRNEKSVHANRLYSIAVEIYTYWVKEWDKGLKEHFPGFEVDITAQLQAFRDLEEQMNIASRDSLMDPVQLEQRRVALQRNARRWPAMMSWMFGYDEDQERCRELQLLNDHVDHVIHTAKRNLDTSNYEQLGRYAAALCQIQQGMGEFLTDALCRRIEELQLEMWDTLHWLRAQLSLALENSNIDQFEMVFLQYNALVQGLAPVYPEVLHGSDGLHLAMCLDLEGRIAGLEQQLSRLQFSAACESVRTLRSLGHVLVGPFCVHYRELALDDHSLKQINTLCDEHFGGEAARHCAVLGVGPDASRDQIQRAYRQKSLETHPDRPSGSTAQQQRVERAKEALLEGGRPVSKPFSAQLTDVPRRLDEKVKGLLEMRDYNGVREVLVALRELRLLNCMVNPSMDGERTRARLLQAVEDHIVGIRAEMRSQWDRRKLQEVNDGFSTLAAFDKALGAFSNSDVYLWKSEIASSIEAELKSRVDQAKAYLHRAATAEANVRELAMQLVYLGRILDALPHFTELATISISNVLEACLEHVWGFTFLFKLGMVLQQGSVGAVGEDGEVTSEDKRIGQVLVSEFRHFKDTQTMIWNQEIVQKDVSGTVDEVASKRVAASNGVYAVCDAPVGRGTLLAGFQEYEAEYDTCFQMWCAGQLEMPDLADMVCAQVAPVSPCHIAAWTRDIKDMLPTLLGRIFAYFTILKSGESYKRLRDAGDDHHAIVGATALANGQASDGGAGDARGEAMNVGHVLLKPHNIQVLSVLRMLGYDTDDTDLASHLMDIRTGEGKSIILGACSTLLGLLGFRVRCVCYSQYLSDRDCSLFKDLFLAFGVSRRIVYSTICQYSCAHVKEQRGDIYRLTEALFRGGSLENRRPPSPVDEEILLVDEVDVFFGEDFYGQTDIRSIFLREPEIRDVLILVWRSRTLPWDQVVCAVKASSAFRALHSKFPTWADYLNKEIEKMAKDVSHLRYHEYNYNRGLNRIGYKDMDGMSYNTTLGYKTAFAYLNEAEKGNLRNPEEALEHGLSISPIASAFSYANLKPACILGVSGTVKVLREFEWRIMNRYGIEVYSHLPSVYGESNFRFLNQTGQSAITVERSKENYFQAISQEVNKVVSSGRAVVVFFQDSRLLDDYAKSPYYRGNLNSNLLHERLSAEEKDHAIKKAATAGQATFSTAVFGRGTDFVCYDPKLLDAGGVHVIQAFVSLSKSEEVQIQGRTARQGKCGTYSMVLLAGKLSSELEISSAQALQLTPAALYELIEQARQAQCHRVFAQMEAALHKADKKDKLSHEYADALLTNDRDLAIEKFMQLQ
ncbi:hypothetical protein CYMTET_50476 [Cymbomonas tetramitiformis]|uniref:non-specific serine/threonine protein kinase n=1 Tax=Cymbomonas tetramitiformis TaxID=36881 RepID=A0AAE0BQ01_9CHLO|nr:hypothetical protein CYMTET_50476 [Cymbomonas tetramitiformis]